VKKAAEAKKVAAKKRPSPQRPTGKMKETDYTNEVVATKFIGGVAMVDVKNASGGTGFKRDLIKALKANDKTREVILLSMFILVDFVPFFQGLTFCVLRRNWVSYQL